MRAPPQRKYVEEFSTSNFVGITTDGKYVTPESPAVLPSITNKSLLDLAEKAFGMPCERRPIALAEVESGAFAEVGHGGGRDDDNDGDEEMRRPTRDVDLLHSLSPRLFRNNNPRE
jgi:hypothetical protein